MAHYEDLSDYGYHDGAFGRPGTKNVGWLASDQPFAQAAPSDAVLDRLWQLCKVSVAQMRGVHECELCGAESAYQAERNGERLLLGTSEIRVFAADGAIFAAPTLIYHYMVAHQYAPPAAFLRALANEPCPPDPAYFDRLRALGLAWTPTSASAGPRRTLF
jgi:hypothetical protein